MPAAIVDEQERRSKCFSRTGFSLSGFEFRQAQKAKADRLKPVLLKLTHVPALIFKYK